MEAAALALVKDSNPEDEVFVVNFNDEAYLDMPAGMDFTTNIDVLQQALKRIDSRGGTAMRDAIQMSIELLKKAAQGQESDGGGDRRQRQLQRHHPGRAGAEAPQSEVLIYSVGLLAEEEQRGAARPSGN